MVALPAPLPILTDEEIAGLSEESRRVYRLALRHERHELSAADPVAYALMSGLALDPWQRELVRSTKKRIIALCSRQSGKSTTVAVRAIHRAVFRPRSTILVVSGRRDQAALMVEKCKAVYGEADCHTEESEDVDGDAIIHLKLRNGSRIVALPGKEQSVRAYSAPEMVIIDEAAIVPDAVFKAIRPTLAVSGGELILLSTPHGRRGMFWEQWRREQATPTGRWDAWEVPATQCPRITPEFLAEERIALGEKDYLQEYMCAWLDAEDAVFRAEDIDAMLHPELPVWNLTA